MIVLLLLVAAAPLPEYLKLAPKVVVNPESVVAERYGQAVMNLNPQPAEKRGRHWYAAASLSDEGQEPAEAWTTGKDFPWLPPPPGAKFLSDSEGGAFYANEKGEPEPVFVSPTSLQKSYELDASYSSLELVTMYREALSKVGWRIVEESQGINQG